MSVLLDVDILLRILQICNLCFLCLFTLYTGLNMDLILLCLFFILKTSQLTW